MKVRKTAAAGLFLVALLSACGDDAPTGDVETGTGGGVETTSVETTSGSVETTGGGTETTSGGVYN